MPDVFIKVAFLDLIFLHLFASFLPFHFVGLFQVPYFLHFDLLAIFPNLKLLNGAFSPLLFFLTPMLIICFSKGLIFHLFLLCICL